MVSVSLQHAACRMQNLHPSNWLAIWIAFLIYICDIEVFDGVLSQYFSGLNSLDVLVQPTFESESFQVLGVENTVNNFFSLMLSKFKFLYGIKQFHYPELVKSNLACNFLEPVLFVRVIITIPFKSFE